MIEASVLKGLNALPQETALARRATQIFFLRIGNSLSFDYFSVLCFLEYRKLREHLPKTGGNYVPYVIHYTDENYDFKPASLQLLWKS